jgi:hypothetical protein
LSNADEGGIATSLTIERAMSRFDLYPARVMGDSAYGSAEMLGWLVYEHGIEPHVTVFDKSARQDGTFYAKTSPMTMPAMSTTAQVARC